MAEDLVVAERRGSTLVLRLNRPEAGNAISRDVALALGSRLRDCESDASLRTLILTGTGTRYFCTGGDVKAYSALATPSELDQVFNLMRDVCDSLERLPCPVVAAINGFAVGGGAEAALACDLRVAEDSAQIGFPQSRLGIMPGWDGTERLLRTVGRSAAARLLYSGKRVSAAEARDMGLVDEVTADGGALGRALEHADTFAEVAPLSLAAIKQGLREAAHACTPDAARQARTLARSEFARLWFSEDHKEAERAFAEKRTPRFNGR